MSGVYIHVPWCRRKCIYCDFYSLGARNADWQRFADCVLAEARSRLHEIGGDVETFYIGGGTPSLMPAPQLRQIAEGLHGLFGDRWKVREFTMEANPCDISPQTLQAWKDAGVNRLSIGVQSFADEELNAIGRRHSSSQARQAVAMAQEVFGNISIDLMFGLPGQSLESWSRSIDEALGLRPQHISAYSLMYEEGTPLTILRDRGSLSEAPESLSEEMLQMLVAKLGQAGYEHYEISNFALPGFRSRHNESYWLGVPYLGLGPAAHSYDGARVRRANPADVNGWMRHDWLSASENFYQEEALNDEELVEEMVLTRMRRREGLDLGLFRKRFGDARAERLLRRAAIHLKAGNIARDGERLHLTERGILVSDAVFTDLAF